MYTHSIFFHHCVVADAFIDKVVLFCFKFYGYYEPFGFLAKKVETYNNHDCNQNSMDKTKRSNYETQNPMLLFFLLFQQFNMHICCVFVLINSLYFIFHHQKKYEYFQEQLILSGTALFGIPYEYYMVYIHSTTTNTHIL